MTIFTYKGVAGEVINMHCFRVSLGNRVSILVHSFYVGSERGYVAIGALRLTIRIIPAREVHPGQYPP